MGRTFTAALFLLAVGAVLVLVQGTDAPGVATPVVRTSGAAADAAAPAFAGASGVSAERRAPDAVAAAPDTAPALRTVEVRVVEKVASNGRVPRAATRVRVEWWGAAAGVLLEGETDAEGIARAEVPAESPEGAWLLGSIVEDGLVPRRAFERDGVIQLVAEAGSAIRGRVVDGAGRGVLARVEFAREPEGRMHFASLQASSLRDGSFWMAVPFANVVGGADAVLRGSLGASAEGIGTTTLMDVAWPVDDPPQDLTLVLRSGGEFMGSVLDGAGRPCPGLPVALRHVDTFAEPRSSLRKSIDGFGRFGAGGDGLSRVFTTTDSTGEIRAAGLRAGSYRAFVSAEGRHWLPAWPPPELTRAPHPIASGPAEFTYDVPRIELRLLDADGEPWPGPIDTSRSAFQNNWGDREETTRVRVVPARPHDGRVVPATDDPEELVSSHAPSNGLVRFDLDYGSDVLVAVHGGSADERFPVTPIHVRMDAGESLCEVVVRAHREVALGKVEIEAMVTTWRESFLPTVLGEEPEPTFDGPSPLFAHGDSYLVIEDAKTGLAIAHPNARTAGVFTVELPAGRYVARVGWRVRAQSPNNMRFGSPYGGATESFEVVAGETTTVRIEAGAGGRVEVENRSGADAKLALVDADGRRRQLLSLRRNEHWDERATDVYPAGETHRSEPSPAGTWRLVGTLGTRDIDRPLTLEDGKSTRVVLD